MEMNRRRSRGFMLSKLMPYCRAVKPQNPSQDLYNNVHYTSSTTTSYAPQHDQYSNNYFTPHDVSPKLTFLLQPSVAPESKDMEKKLNVKLMGRAGINGVEECVDARAASYISSVRERFKQDHFCESRTTVITLNED